MQEAAPQASIFGVDLSLKKPHGTGCGKSMTDPHSGVFKK